MTVNAILTLRGLRPEAAQGVARHSDVCLVLGRAVRRSVGIGRAPNVDTNYCSPLL